MARRRLSDRQKQRIEAIQQRRRQRLEERAQQALTTADADSPREGVVITRHGQTLGIRGDERSLYHCLCRQNIGHPVCGDRVVWQPMPSNQGVVTALLERTTSLARPVYSGEHRALAANLSQLAVVLAPAPPPSSYLLDQYLIAAEGMGVSALIAVNKKDLFNDEESAAFEQAFGHYRDIGYPIIWISAKYEHGLDPLIGQLRDKTSILVGQSGVGKSSLIKALLPDIEIQIGRLSDASGLGKHTTSATTLYDLPQGGQLIDSPGVRSFRLGQLDKPQLEQGFREFRPYLGHCRFADCSHHQEPGCALIEAVGNGLIAPQRLTHFQHMAAGLQDL